MTHVTQQKGWMNILSDGHVVVARMNSKEAQAPVIGWLQHTNKAIAVIVIVGFFGGSAAIAKLMQYGHSAATAISQPTAAQKDDPRAALHAADTLLAGMYRLNVELETGQQKPVKVTAADIAETAPQLLTKASKGEITTSYKGGPLAEDDIVSVVAADKVVWLLSKVAPESTGQRHRIWIAAARKTDDGWKLFSISGVHAPQQGFLVPDKTAPIPLSSIPRATAELIKATTGGTK
jgi:hypothetical protein